MDSISGFEGEWYVDDLSKTIYATDASVYRVKPQAIAIPKTNDDIKRLIQYAMQHNQSLMPRAAGTSLAGQCVGEGIVVDVSKHLNKIIDFNPEEQWIKVQPGIVRDELNAYLKPHGLFFSPITSTANRATIGGMVGNNSSGTTSILYGTTREHVLALDTILSDGTIATFEEIDKTTFYNKMKLDSLEGALYRHIHDSLSEPIHQENIRNEFPKPSIHRRNTGYALDYLLNSSVFTEGGDAFNFCKLLCGSEGTLAFTTAIKIHLDKLPAPENVVLAAHFDTVQDSLKATQIAMQFQPYACELMDKIILDCTEGNIEQSKNRFFVEGDPRAILMVEFRRNSKIEAEAAAKELEVALKKAGLGFAYPLIPKEKVASAWKLRSAGLGLLANIPGDQKAVACIEDTAVDIDDLPEYIAEFTAMMDGFGQQSVYYAHAGAGEIHLRPILDLKKAEDVEQFYQISEACAKLVKKYKGSLSGEHGDGRVRAAFIPMMVGESNYQLFRALKTTWDPNHIFNPGKIVDAPPMNEALRYEKDQETKQFDTVLDFSNTKGILRAAEKCNGSGDCRKLPLSGGTMCPSYQATRNEKDTTRARANTLREMLTRSPKDNPFDHEEIKEVMDLCLSCKGCTSECPSNVDMAGLKAEFLHQYYQSNGIPLRARAFAYIDSFNKLGGIAPSFYNFFLKNAFFSSVFKKILGVAPARSMPTIHRESLRKWFRKTKKPISTSKNKVYLFCDEFTNWNDTPIGIKAIQLLWKLGYEVEMIAHEESGRAAISKGLLKKAQAVAVKNVNLFSEIVDASTPLIGIEPSTILTFRDEYPRLVDPDQVAKAKQLAKHCLLIDEFIANEIKAGHISKEVFTKEPKNIKLHGHCHQKSLSDVADSVWLLSLPENYNVELIASGCCGMAGSFGYEAEHYEVSQQVGELVLLPAVRAANGDTIIAATGTSCRHQIKDGTGRLALHPVEVLYEALTW